MSPNPLICAGGPTVRGRQALRDVRERESAPADSRPVGEDDP
jgi:hypothetical protein